MMLPLLRFVTVICHSRRNNSNNGEYWKVTYPILSINDIVKIKVNSYKRTGFVSLFRNKNITFAYQYNDTNIHYMNKIVQPQWLEWAKELQFIAQVGLTYSKDVFDIERFERIREIAAEMLSLQSGIPTEKVKNLFCNETGFQTPKLDTRAAIFKDDKILLVKEKNGTWSLPGGWVDINQSIKTNTEKEVKEEAGLNVKAIRIIAIQDRNLHNIPPYAYNVCKVFVLCEIESGYFRPNIETDESAYFGLEELPILAKEKNNEEQIKMCFSAYYDKNWQVLFD